MAAYWAKPVEVDAAAEDWGNVMADSFIAGLPAPMPGQITLEQAKKNVEEANKKAAAAKKAADAKKAAEAAAAAAAKAKAAAQATPPAVVAAAPGINWAKVAKVTGIVLVTGGIVIGGVWYVRQSKAA
jgi:sRNA-binding protein